MGKEIAYFRPRVALSLTQMSQNRSKLYQFSKQGDPTPVENPIDLQIFRGRPDQLQEVDVKGKPLEIGPDGRPRGSGTGPISFISLRQRPERKASAPKKEKKTKEPEGGGMITVGGEQKAEGKSQEDKAPTGENVCPKCKRKFKSVSGFKSHMRSHGKGK